MKLYFTLIARGKYVQVNFSLFIFLLSRERWSKDYMKKLENDKLPVFILLHTLKNVRLNVRLKFKV